MGTHALDLVQSPRDLVFRAMETIVRQNATFQRIVKPSSFRTWQGKPDDAKEFTFQVAPALRWTPMHTGEDFKTPDTMAGDLLINCEILLPGTNVSDLTNFWWMLDALLLPKRPGRSEREYPGPPECRGPQRPRALQPARVRPRPRRRVARGAGTDQDRDSKSVEHVMLMDGALPRADM